jgi:hypothetical protein
MRNPFKLLYVAPLVCTIAYILADFFRPDLGKLFLGLSLGAMVIVGIIECVRQRVSKKEQDYEN